MKNPENIFSLLNQLNKENSSSFDTKTKEELLKNYYNNYHYFYKNNLSFFYNGIDKIRKDYSKNELHWEKEEKIISKWLAFLNLDRKIINKYNIEILKKSILISGDTNFFEFVKSKNADIAFNLIRAGYNLDKLETIIKYLIEVDRKRNGEVKNNLSIVKKIDSLNERILIYLIKWINLIEKRVNSILKQILSILELDVKSKINYKQYTSSNDKKFIQTTISSNIINNKKIIHDMRPDKFIDSITFGQKITFLDELNFSDKNKAIIFSLQFLKSDIFIKNEKNLLNLEDSNYKKINDKFFEILRKFNDIRNMTHHNNFIFHKSNMEAYKELMKLIDKYFNKNILSEVIAVNSIFLSDIFLFSKKIKSKRFYNFILNNLVL